jgi:hypothetical protein
MKNILKLLGIIALVAVIGFGVIACDNGGGGGGGGGGSTSLAGTTWKATMEGMTLTLSLTQTTYTISFTGGNIPPETGSYTVSGNTVTINSPEMGKMTGTLSADGKTLTINEMGGLVFTKQ